ncbi:MAG: hypothetical protein U0667_06350 [Chloroflexota bacterium]
MSVLESVAPGIGGLVVARQVVTPVDLERDLGMTGHPPTASHRWTSGFSVATHARLRPLPDAGRRAVHRAQRAPTPVAA